MAWSLPVHVDWGPRVEGILTEDSQSRWKSTLRYALMPSTAPGRVIPRRSRAKRTTYGMVAVIHTTWESNASPGSTSHPLAGWPRLTLVGGLWLGTHHPKHSQDARSARLPAVDC